jgi:hypothetical protein
MREGRGALFGISGQKDGHAMVMIHFDEDADCVLYIDNSDRALKIRSMSIDEFNKNWDRWALVIYADNDIIPYRLNGNYRQSVNHTEFGFPVSRAS